MRNMKAKWGILVLVVIIGFQACERPMEKAVGYDHVITVVCEDENWEACEPILAETLGKVFKTPRTETLYTFHRIDSEDLNLNIHNKNILIITRMESYSSVTKQVKSMLPDTTLKQLRRDPRGYYHQADAYALGQALVVVAGNNLADIRSRLKVNQDEIFDFYERQMYQRSTAFVYRSGEQFELAEKYFNQHGYYLRMMHDYVEIENDAEKQLVWLGRDFPYRWLSVSWSTPDDSTTLEQQLNSLLKTTLTEKMGSTELNEDYLTMEPFWLKEYSAYKFYGLWQSKEEVKGGPLMAYGFYEPTKDRVYLLMGIVHAPDKAKIPYLRQMETIFRTFDTKVYETD